MCNSFKPKILNGELCYALEISSSLKTRAGRGKGLLLAIDKGISIEPHTQQMISANKKNFIRTELKSTGKKARLHILTSHWHEDSRPGKYAMKSLKVMEATENFLLMPDDVKGCLIETMEDCKSQRYLEEVKKLCGCTPWPLSTVDSNQVLEFSKKDFKILVNVGFFLILSSVISDLDFRFTTSALQMKPSVPLQ